MAKVKSQNLKLKGKSGAQVLATILMVGFLMFTAADHVFAQDLNLIVCDPASDNEAERCNFGHLMLLVKNLINALILFSTFFATAAFAFAGIKLLSSGGNEKEKNDAKNIFFKVLIGYLWILGAWVLIYTITSVLLDDRFVLLD